MARSANSASDMRVLSSFPAIAAKKLICCSLEGGAYYYVSKATFAHVDFETGKQTDMKIEGFDKDFQDVIEVHLADKQMMFVGVAKNQPDSNTCTVFEFFLLNSEIKTNKIIIRDKILHRFEDMIFKSSNAALFAGKPTNLADQCYTCYAYIQCCRGITFRSFILRLTINVTGDELTLCETINVQYRRNEFNRSNLETNDKYFPRCIVQDRLFLERWEPFYSRDKTRYYDIIDLSKRNQQCFALQQLWHTDNDDVDLACCCAISSDIIAYEHGDLMLLDTNRQWRKACNLLFTIEEHVISDVDSTSICSTENEIVFIYGKCKDRICRMKENVHIYVFDINVWRLCNSFDVINDEKYIIGTGSFSKVIAGKLKSYGDVAIKILKGNRTKENTDKQQMARMALIEASMLITIDHQNIVKGLGFAVEKDRILILMELMEKSVKTKISETAEGKLSESETLTILKNILHGLVYLHTMKPKPIVHRDIKCDNILLSKDGTAKICDLGLLKTVTLNTAGTTVEPLHGNAGTIAYIAPEVIQGEPYGRKSDVWSLGCAVIEMLTGHPPYKAVLMDLQKQRIALLWPTKMATLTYSAEDLIPEASKTVKTTVNEMLTIGAKKERFSDKKIRPHSWELLADVTERFDLQPAENLLKEYDASMAVFCDQIYDQETLLTNIKRNGNTLVMQSDYFRNQLQERSANILSELQTSVEMLESMKNDLRQQTDKTRLAISDLKKIGNQKS